MANPVAHGNPEVTLDPDVVQSPSPGVGYGSGPFGRDDYLVPTNRPRRKAPARLEDLAIPERHERSQRDDQARPHDPGHPPWRELAELEPPHDARQETERAEDRVLDADERLEPVGAGESLVHVTEEQQAADDQNDG